MKPGMEIVAVLTKYIYILNSVINMDHYTCKFLLAIYKQKIIIPRLRYGKNCNTESDYYYKNT